MEKPDETLMLEHQQGDQEAMAILFERYAEKYNRLLAESLQTAQEIVV